MLGGLIWQVGGKGFPFSVEERRGEEEDWEERWDGAPLGKVNTLKLKKKIVTCKKKMHYPSWLANEVQQSAFLCLWCWDDRRFLLHSAFNMST